MPDRAGTSLVGAPAQPARVLTAVLAIATAGVLPPFLLAAAGVRLQREYGLSDAGLGALISTFFIVAGIVARPLGRQVDALGWRRSTRRVAPLSIAVLIAIGLGGTGTGVLVLLVALSGLTHGASAPIANLAVVTELDARRHGVLFGLKQSAPSAALFLSGLAVPTVIATAGWRPTFVLAALVPLVALVTVPTAGPRASRDRERSGRRRVVDRGWMGLITPTVAGGLAASTVTATSSFLLVTIVASGGSEHRGGLLLSLGAVLSILVRITIGWVADRRPGRPLAGVTLLLLLGACGLTAIATGSLRAITAGAMLAFAAGSGWPGLYQLAVVRRFHASPATATGTIQTGLSLGAAMGPAAFGLVADAGGYPAAWAATAAVAVLSSSLLATTAHRRRVTPLPSAPG